MKKYLVLVICSLILTFSLPLAAVDWLGTTSDDWTDAANWDGNVPTSGVHAYIYNTNPAVIYEGDTGSSNQCFISSSGDGAILTVEGTLNSHRLRMGTVNGEQGTVVVAGGTINMNELINVGFQGLGTLIMNGGQISGATVLQIPSPFFGNTGYGVLELNDGVINTADIFMNSHGQLNVGDGKIVVSANVLSKVNGYVANGWIVAEEGFEIDISFDGQDTTIQAIEIETPAYMMPYADLIGYSGLWHMDTLADANDLGYEGTPDDDSDNPGRARHLVKYSGANPVAKGGSGGPTLVVPDDYPADNPDFDKCFYFNGTSDSLRLTGDNNLTFDKTNFKVEMWLKVDEDNLYQTSGTRYDYEIFRRLNQLRIWLRRDTDNLWYLHYQIWAEDGLSRYPKYSYSNQIPQTPFEWHHIALEVYGGDIVLYVNGGELTATNAFLNNQVCADPTNDITALGSTHVNAQHFCGWMDEVMVSPAVWISPDCGGWGYSPADFNKDCVVDIQDFAIMASEWLQTYEISGAAIEVQSRNIPLPGNYNVPQATIVPTIDGTISAGEWDDAKPIEMIYPDLVQNGNTGTLTRLETDPPTPEQYSAYWYMKWDTSGLYVLGRIYDDFFAEPMGLDEPQFLFNLNNDPSAQYLQEAIVWNIPANGSINVNGGLPYNNSVVAGSVVSDGYIIEFKLDWSDLTSVNGGVLYVPELEDVHGMGFTCQNHGEDYSRLFVMNDYGSGVWTMLDYSTWNTITLVDELSCGDLGYKQCDLDENCIVGVSDLKEVAPDWLKCSDPFVEGCEDFRF